MSILILVAVLAVAFLAVGFTAQKLSDLVRGDGSTQRSSTRTPPRSHHADQFDPRSRTA
jgi:hypothetical protein